MAEELSKVPPFFLAVLVCDEAMRDRRTGKTSLIGIFDRITVATFPTSRPMSLYMRLIDAEGYYQMRIEFVHADKDVLLTRVEGTINSPDRSVALEAIYQTPPLPIPEPGRYEFRIHANNMYLGNAAILVRPRPK